MFRSFRDLVRVPNKPKAIVIKLVTSYSCDLCSSDNAKWHTETDVEIHKRNVHSDEIATLISEYPEKYCTVCMTLFDNYTQLLSHIKTNHLFSSPDATRIEREIFVCNYCQNLFFNKELLAVHIMYFHLYVFATKNQKLFTCPICFKDTKLKAAWHHLQNHEIPSVTFCDICLKNQPSKKALLEHCESHKKYYNCDDCNYRSLKRTLFNKHLQNHYARPIKNVKNAGKIIKNAFLNHRGSSRKYYMHNSLKGLCVPTCIDLCVLCREICTDRIEVKNHICRDHTYDGENFKKKGNVCVCGEEFFNKVLLKQHVFKMGGYHRAFDEHQESIPERPVSLISVVMYADKCNKDVETNPESVLMRHDNNDEHIVGL